jgi:signal peptidase I
MRARAVPTAVASVPGAHRVPTTYTAGLVSQRPFGCLFEVVETLVLTLVIFLVIQNFVAQPYQVQQMSMENTLQPGEYVLVDKLTPRFDDYSRGDVIVFKPPVGYDQGGDTPFIKRVIGLPGDRVSIRDGGVYVNGVLLDEPYTYPGTVPNQPTEAPPDRTDWTVAPGELFVLGDHREQSSDSRVFGTIQRDSVVGRAWLRYWPFNVFGILPTPTYPEVPAGTP